MKLIPPVRLVGLTRLNKLFYNSTKRFIVVAAGRRSRKTLIGMRKILLAAMKVEEKLFILAAPTRLQAKNIFWESLKKDTTDLRIKISESELSVTLYSGSKIALAGLDRPETTIEGRAISGIMITEVADMKKRAWVEAIRPALADEKGFAILESVPGGKGYFYELALYAAGGILPPVKEGQGAYAESDYDEEWAFFAWFSSDVLDASEIAAAKRQMDERSFRQEFRAEFLSGEGNLYYVYDGNKHKKKMEPIDDQPLYLTCDFNKSPMTWEVAQLVDKTLYVVDELSISFDAKTKALAYEFVQRYNKRANKTVFLTGDASNQYESHRDHSSDYVMIMDMLAANGFQVINRVMKSNPSINNRTNIVNSLLHQGRLYIGDKCNYLKKDFEGVTGDGKGGKDKENPELTHASDALDYLVWLLFSKEFYKKAIEQVKIR